MSEIFFFQIFAFHIFAFHISCSLFVDDFINDYYVFAGNICHFCKIWLNGNEKEIHLVLIVLIL